MWAERGFCNTEPNVVHKWATKGSCKISTSRLFRSKAAVPPMELSAFDWRMWHTFLFSLQLSKCAHFCAGALKTANKSALFSPCRITWYQGWRGGGAGLASWCWVVQSTCQGLVRSFEPIFDFGNWFCLSVNQIGEALKLVTSRIGFKLLYRFGWYGGIFSTVQVSLTLSSFDPIERNNVFHIPVWRIKCIVP